jgi:hypothetical protein
VESTELTYRAVGGTKELECALSGLTASDLCNSPTRFPNVVNAVPTATSPGEPPRLVVRYRSRGAAPPQAANPALEYDNLVEVDVGRVRIVYFNQYWLELIDYLCEGVLGEAITGTIKTADALVRQRVGSNTAFRFSIASPEVVLPRRLSCADHALIDVETLELSTFFEWTTLTLRVDREEEIILRRLAVRVQNLRLSLESPDVDPLPVLKEAVACDVDIIRPLDSDYATQLARAFEGVDVHAIVINGRITTIGLRATSANYAFVFRVLSDNILSSRHHAEDALRSLRTVDLGGPQSGLGAGTGVSGVCGQCQDPYEVDKDVAHRCPQCGRNVCRRCLAVNVFDKVAGAVRRICTTCARQNFPRLFSADEQAQRVAYSYGLEDGLLTAFKVSVH